MNKSQHVFSAFGVRIHLLMMLVIAVFGLTLLNLGCAKKKEVLKIGLVQIVSHPQLDEIRDTIIAEMAKQGYVQGKNVKFDLKNAQGQMSVAQTIVKGFVAERAELIIPLTTPCAQAAAQSTSEIPIVFAAVTDPVGAGISKSFESSGRNVTGVSDLFPVEKQIDLILEILPKTKKIGVPYNPGEQNSVKTVEEMIKPYSRKLGIQVITVPVSSTAEIFSAASSLVGRVDVIYTANDMTIASSYESVIKVATRHKIPFFVSATDGVERGAIATLGINYAEVGKKAAEYAVKVLKGTKPKDIPIATVEKADLYINLKAAREMGVTIPAEIIKKAKKVYE